MYTVHTENEERRKRGKGVFLTKFDLNSGKTETEKVISGRETDLYFVPSYLFQEIDDNKTVFLGYKWKGLFPKYKKLTLATFDFN